MHLVGLLTYTKLSLLTQCEGMCYVHAPVALHPAKNPGGPQSRCGWFWWRGILLSCWGSNPGAFNPKLVAISTALSQLLRKYLKIFWQLCNVSQLMHAFQINGLIHFLVSSTCFVHHLFIIEKNICVCIFVWFVFNTLM